MHIDDTIYYDDDGNAVAIKAAVCFTYSDLQEVFFYKKIEEVRYIRLFHGLCAKFRECNEKADAINVKEYFKQEAIRGAGRAFPIVGTVVSAAVIEKRSANLREDITGGKHALLYPRYFKTYKGENYTLVVDRAQDSEAQRSISLGTAAL